jgi:superoxide reductase
LIFGYFIIFDILTLNQKRRSMPRIFNPVDISREEKEVRKDYFDRHTPVIICDDVATEGKKFKVKVRLGTDYTHPDDPGHFINYVQLWNRETFLAQIHFAPGTLANRAEHVEVDIYIVPGAVTMNLSAMSACTKHGLWQSASKEVAIRKP